MSFWHRHPGVRSDTALTRGERAADTVRNGMGSWGFVGCFGLFLLAWAAANSALYLGGHNGRHGFDPYPYILLNLFLSMLAAIQGAILLIAAKRADQIASELALHTERNTESTLAMLQQNTTLTTEVHALTAEVHAHIVKEEPHAEDHPQ